ncbi:glycosyltransferase family 4 protein [Bacillus taeanensis]|uniref:Glycosyl transferase family 1 n=1 Tax=Bacillus taeanensis TaxID=273032 RepID=A0A366XUM1_9BACI|nr:glycosyltransferase family 4 protein [Bacillus taeanensis]RBW69597.1 glycosyl transferase family 1 [Bacillus taeanensis]
MKIVLVTPNYHQPRGNTITVKRISDKLNSRGIETEIVSITEDHHVNMLPPADLVHGFHAYRFFKFKETLHQKMDTYVITMTGTDLNHDLFNDERRSDVIQSVTEASAVHVFSEKARNILLKEVPEIKEKTFVIPQGTTNFTTTDFTIQKEDNTFLFVLPAGIRKVKNVPFAIHTLKKLHEKLPYVRLLLVGPIIEKDEGQLVKNLVEENKDWVQYIGQVSHHEMGAIYKHADAVLNTSHSEGQSTAIIEAMSLRIPLLVSGNEGNLSLITHNQTGFVYNDEGEFLEYAEQLVNNYEIREQFGEAAEKHINKHHTNTSEVEMLLKIYEDVLVKP